MFSAFALGASGAMAQDLISYEDENPFHGFYAGVHTGYGVGRVEEGIEFFGGNDSDFLTLLADWGADVDGALIGAQGGINVVLDQGLMVGGEVSISWAALQGSGSVFDAIVDDGSDYPFDGGSYETAIDGLGTAELKVGFATDEFIVYASAGIAMANVNSTVTVGGVTQTSGWIAQNTASGVMQGWTVGVGGAVMVTPSASVNLSVNYADFGTLETTDVDTFFTGDDDLPVSVFRTTAVTQTTVKLGVNQHF